MSVGRRPTRDAGSDRGCEGLPARGTATASKRRTWRTDERGATSIEYAIIAGLVSCAIFVAVQVLGMSLAGVFASIGDQFDATPPPATPNGVHGGHA